MTTRRWTFSAAVVALLLGAGMPAQAAKVTSENFIVEARSQAEAEEFARLAEKYRKEKAIDWLGREMPRWKQPCPLRVTVTSNGAGGATTFDFNNGQVNQSMHIEGNLERLKNSVLPHEVCHTVFAHHFRQPVPRWADEGGSVYSEDELERSRHDLLCRQILNAGDGIQLRALFQMKEYPKQVMVLYAEGYSVTRFLVEKSDRQSFLNFIGHGMQHGWDDAVQTYYRYKNVDELEKAWIDHLRKNRGTLARNPQAPPASNARLVVRDSAPPVRPSLDPAPVSRGLSPTVSYEKEPLGPVSGWNRTPARLGDPIPAPAVSSEVGRATIGRTPDNEPAGGVVIPPPAEPTPENSSITPTSAVTPRPSRAGVMLLPPEPLPFR